MTKADLKALVESARSKMNRRSFTVSRKVTGRGGDCFHSMSVELDEGTSPQEAKVAYLLAFLECHETTFRAARAGSLVTDAEFEQALKHLRHNFSHMIALVTGAE